MRRPARWDHPFDPNLNESLVEHLLQVAPFKQMDPDRFPPRIPLAGILRNDCRYLNCKPGEIIVREGGYGNSAFLILSGTAIATLQQLPSNPPKRSAEYEMGWWKALSQLWTNPKVAEVRNGQSTANPLNPARTKPANAASMFIQDLPRMLSAGHSAQLTAGEMFGEMAAFTRTPRTTTVVAAVDCELLEIRWQGLRELLKFDSELKRHLDLLYRTNSLHEQLQQTPLFAGLPSRAIQEIATTATFGTWGSFDWNNQFRIAQQSQEASEKILHEPLIVTEGDYVNGLILIRSGFARLSRQHGVGHRTIAYLGKGHTFGLRELYHNWKMKRQLPYLLSLRAIGYVDTIHVPTEIVEKWLFPNLTLEQTPPPIADGQEPLVRERRQQSREEPLETSLLEFLLESRVINGTQAMLVDRDRCTRCDDCVRACAIAHQGNPRFIRSGAIHDHWMIAQACMHCMDPVCMIGCPTGAIRRDEHSGVIHINDSTCIGCGTCANSCPYQNIQMVPIRSSQGEPIIGENDQLPILKATKCDLCMEQLGGPACQRACPHDALLRIDLTSPGPLADFLKGNS